MSISVAVVGASGYAGGELIRLLDAHPVFSVELLGANSKAGSALGDVHPQLSGGERPLVTFDQERFGEVDAVFFALPHGASASPAVEMLARGVAVIDLGADFRFDDPDRYRNAYGTEHPHPEQLGEFVYGVPELFADAVRGTDRVAVPGCYPTATIVPLAPLASAGLVDTSDIVVDAMSGVTGAGRAVSESTAFGAIDESVRAYKVLGHRHQPEMIQGIERFASGEVRVVFTPHLVPMLRGILSTIHVKTNPGVEFGDVVGAFDGTYADEPFVRRLEVPPETRWVVGSNNALVSYHLNGSTGHLIALCAIDNLLKGAAGQAVQCANLMFGLEQTVGLSTEGSMP
ncbi:MAG: N-acetyl-gamma-glutamyl-phosphate reductase [Acidimicrobiia bacterium]